MRVCSYVVETPVSEQVNLRDEHVSVERPAAAGDELFRERTIEATETGIGAAISGFGLGDIVDLGAFAYTSAATRGFVATAGGSGTLTVSTGGQAATLTLIGSYVTSDFSLSADATGGTRVTFA